MEQGWVHNSDSENKNRSWAVSLDFTVTIDKSIKTKNMDKSSFWKFKIQFDFLINKKKTSNLYFRPG